MVAKKSTSLILGSFCLGAIVLFLLALSPSAHGQSTAGFICGGDDGGETPTCSNSDLSGDWTFLCDGINTTTEPPGYIAYVGVFTIDEAGQLSGSGTARLSDGSIAEFTFAGSVDVADNCSLKLESLLSNGETWSYAKVINSDKSELRGIITQILDSDGNKQPLRKDVCIDRRQ
jgi:hypothetical protein